MYANLLDRQMQKYDNTFHEIQLSKNKVNKYFSAYKLKG